MIEEIDGDTFHDIFEIVQKYLKNGDVVDVHDADFYRHTKNYISDDGLSGFSITQDGDLVSVFNLGESGFLKTIKDFAAGKGAVTLDCFDSDAAYHLPKIYNKALGFKTAAIMAFNYDFLVAEKGKDYADWYVKTYGESPVAFMVKTDREIPVKYFTKNQLDEAVAYRNSFVNKNGAAAVNEAPANAAEPHAPTVNSRQGGGNGRAANLRRRLKRG